MQLSTLHSNNGALVQTEPSVALASLANQLIRRQGVLSSGGGIEYVFLCVCVLLCFVQKH